MDLNESAVMNDTTEHLVAEQVERFDNIQLLAQAFDSIDISILALNKNRQLIFANKSYLKLLKINDLKLIIGKRVGNTLNCIHTYQGDMCGSTQACKNCTVQNTILKSISLNEEASSEAYISRNIDGYQNSLNVYEQVVPIKSNTDTFYLLSFVDATDSVRKRSLERIFFHDILNTTGALKGLLSLLKDDVPDNVKPEVDLIEDFFQGLIEEIQSQKQLAAAENNELVATISDINSMELINSVKKLYETHETFVNKIIEIGDDTVSVVLRSDSSLLKRVIENMLKNALEATSQYDVITMGCNYSYIDGTKSLKFWIHNNSYINPDTQSKMFVRSFSTKGVGRGIGTYSMKLLGEKYLNGSVGFTTSKADGTEFYIVIPL